MRRPQATATPARRRSLRRVPLVVACCTALLAVAALPALAERAARPPKTVLASATVPLVDDRPEGARAAARRGTRSGSVRLAIRANLVGASWRGTGSTVALRARGADGRWSVWTSLVADAQEGPDAASREASNDGRTHATLPAWVGDATALEVRAAAGSDVRDLRVVAINTTGTATASDRLMTGLRTSAARVLGAPTARDASAAPTTPAIVSRAQWGADESLRRANPIYASSLKAAVVHHTVSANSYAPSDVPAMLRGIYSYHVKSNGWNDIGYNFLVDQYGTVYEGRGGGVTAAVIGAHTGGFNTSTAGVAFLGTHTSTAPTSAAQAAVANLLSWRLDLAHVNPTASVTLTSAGNSSYPAGTTVTRRAVSGHRDLYATSCPGAVAYDTLGTLAATAWASGGPKFVDPRAVVRTAGDGTVAGARFTASGTTAFDWTLRLTRAVDGALVYEHTAPGATSFDHDWPGTSAVGSLRADEIRWSLAASSGGVAATPHEASLGTQSPPVTVGTSGANARWITPNGDGVVERLTFDAVVSGPATLDARLYDRATRSKLVSTLFTGRSVVGETPLTLGGTLANGQALPDGDYSLKLTAHDPVPGRPVKIAWLNVGIDRSIRFTALTPRISPNGDRRLDAAAARVGVEGAAQPISVVIRHAVTGKTLRTVPARTLSGAVKLSFDGRRSPAGRALPEGSYDVVIRSVRSQGAVELPRRLVVDVTRPSLRVQKLRRGKLRLRASETATLVAQVRVGARVVRRTMRLRYGPNVTGRLKGATLVTIYDRAGNARVVRIRR